MKILFKDGFLCFPVFVALEKMSQRKNIFSQHKKYDLFLQIVFHKLFFLEIFHSKLNKKSFKKMFFNSFEVTIKHRKMR